MDEYIREEIQDDLNNLDVDAAEDERTRAILRLVEQTAKQNLILADIAEAIEDATAEINDVYRVLGSMCEQM